MKPRRRQQIVQAGLYAVLAAGLAALVVVPPWGEIQDGFADLSVARRMFPEVVTVAVKNTVLYTATSFVFGLVLGLVLALMKGSSVRPYRWFATTYIEIFRALPALVTIFLVGYAVPILFKVQVPGGYLGKVTLGLGIVAAAYMAETIRSGIEAVPKGQMEAARSLGMSHGRAMVSIVLPQAFRIIIPPLTNEFVLIIKDTSLLFVVGTTPLTRELTKFARDTVTSERNSTPFIVAALIYLVITLPLTYLVRRLEERTGRSR